MRLLFLCSIAPLLFSRSTDASNNMFGLGRAAMAKSVRRQANSPFLSSSNTAVSEWSADTQLNESRETDEQNMNDVEMCAAAIPPVAANILKGALLRIASDITGGTPLENIKCRVTATTEGPMEAARNIMSTSGIQGLWSGTPSRTIEGALLGAFFLVGSAATKKRVLAMTGSKTMGSLAGGVVGGVAQAVVMTPAALIFTSLNLNKGKPGFENDTAITVARRVINEKGVKGLYAGIGPMATRQASNWASRSLFTEICRTNLKLSRFGLVGEIASGTIGGVGSCWNTPIETCRVYMHKDVSQGLPAKTFFTYFDEIKEAGGVPGLFRGVTPRAVQAVVQTVFMVTVPNLLGL